MKSKLPRPADKHVGTRIRMRRIMRGMSQEKLGEALGLTFQQIQKYEKGVNRIGSSRMVQIAEILQTPIAWFFEGVEVVKVPTEIDMLPTIFATRQGARLATAFLKISDPAVRTAFVNLAEALGQREAPV